MYEYLIHPITLLCLATIFILVALLFFYFKRSLSFLERAQMEQARVLQSFIANMEMNNMRQQQMVGGTPSPIHQTPIPDSELIDVSDDEDSDDETDSDESDSDDESVDETTQQITPTSQVIELSDEVDSDNIKVIQINSNNSLEANIPLEIDELVMDKNNESSSSEEEDDDSDDEDDENDENETMNVVEPTNLVTNANHEEQVDYKSLTVVSLREIAESKGLIRKGDKTTKKDLLKLLE